MLVRSIKDLENLSLELHSREMYFPENVTLLIKVNDIIYDKLTITRRFDIITPHTMSYTSSHGYNFVITRVSE